MTSFRDAVGRSLGVGTRFELELTVEDGRLVAPHPYDASPMDVVVVEGADRLEARPPSDPVAVEILDRIVDGRIAARVVDGE